ncbi:MAG: alpha-amylase [Pelomonas sp.]|nr:alpha-amylase [Roseateles sp.]
MHDALPARRRLAGLALTAFAACTALPAAAAPALDTAHVDARPSPSPLADGWEHGAFMEIFVRAYQDSKGDGVGDLRGLTARLDYLQALGVKGIWLMPITASSDHDHGYATVDYRRVEPAYGDLADFDALIAAAHARGIGVIIDYVFNHASAEFPPFEQALAGPDAPYRDWFVWQDRTPLDWSIWGHNPWTATPTGAYYGTFGGHMPDFNLRNPAALDYHFSSLRFWLNRGLDGFRLDAVPHLIENGPEAWNDQPESRALAKRIQDLVKSYPRRFVVCEATAAPLVYARPDVCGSAFAFDFQYEIVKAARGEPVEAAAALPKVADYFRHAPPSMATMLSNHDIFAGQRLWDQLHGDAAGLKLAAATYLLMPGTPFIYYGEEIGQAGRLELDGDGPIRAPMSWDADGRGFSTGQPFRPIAPNAATHNPVVEAADPNSVLNFYKAMIALRNRRRSIAAGDYAAATQGLLMVLRRRLGAELSVVLINYGAAPAQVALDALPPGAALPALYPRGAAAAHSDAGGRANVTVPARAVLVLQADRQP